MAILVAATIVCGAVVDGCAGGARCREARIAVAVRCAGAIVVTVLGTAAVVGGTVVDCSARRT